MESVTVGFQLNFSLYLRVWERELLFDSSQNQTGLLFRFWFRLHMLRPLIEYTHWATVPLCQSVHKAMGVLTPHFISKATRHRMESREESLTVTGALRQDHWRKEIEVWQWVSVSPIPLSFNLFLFFSTGRIHWKPPIKSLKTSPAPSASPTLSGPIRRSISCPRSISSLSSPSEVRALSSRPFPAVPMATPLVRPSSATLRSHSLSRSGSAHRVPHSNSLGTIHSHIVRCSIQAPLFIIQSVLYKTSVTETERVCWIYFQIVKLSFFDVAILCWSTTPTRFEVNSRELLFNSISPNVQIYFVCHHSFYLSPLLFSSCDIYCIKAHKESLKQLLQYCIGLL